jgi:uncharacterized protein
LEFAVKLRIPEWTRQWSAAVNGEATETAIERGYLIIRRAWRSGDAIDLNLPMPVERLYANPRVRDDIGKVALRRGPLIYCIEEADNPDAPVALARLPRTAEPVAERRSDLFGGAVAISAAGEIVSADGALYQGKPFGSTKAKITAIPYYLWANRGPGAMRVWLPEL